MCFQQLKEFRLIFNPFFFAPMVTEESSKSFNFNDIDFCKVFAIHR